MTVELKHPTILLRGGPLDGRGYYVKDFQQLLRAEEWAGRATCSYYQNSETQGIHPQTGGERSGQLSTFWDWCPPPPEPEPEPPPPSKLEDVRVAIAMLGERGGTVHMINAQLSYPAEDRQVAVPVWWLKKLGVIEASPGYDPHYRIRR